MTALKSRIFVEKRPEFRTEAESLRRELNSNLGLDIRSLRLLCVYDLFGFTPELIERSSYRVFGEPATDTVSDTVETEECHILRLSVFPDSSTSVPIQPRSA